MKPLARIRVILIASLLISGLRVVHYAQEAKLPEATKSDHPQDTKPSNSTSNTGGDAAGVENQTLDAAAASLTGYYPVIPGALGSGMRSTMDVPLDIPTSAIPGKKWITGGSIIIAVADDGTQLFGNRKSDKDQCRFDPFEPAVTRG